MQTLNGKLIIEESSDLEDIKHNIETLAQQFTRLELEMTVMNKKDKTEYLNQLTSAQQSLQKLERIYNRLMSTAILTAIGLVSWSVWLGFNPDTTPAKVANSKVAIASLRAGASR